VGTLDLAQLQRDGWRVHYLQPYAHATRTEDVCPPRGRYMLVGAVEGGAGSKSTRLVVAAAGLRSVVTRATASASHATSHHGAFWYFNNQRGASPVFGFSPTEHVLLQGADRWEGGAGPMTQDEMIRIRGRVGEGG
jgi:hypothetical protein